MTDKELRKLSRADLLEILLEQGKETEQLRAELEEAQAKLAQRQIAIDHAGSIAEASLRLSGVFEAAQDACLQYTENIRTLSERQEAVCRQMEQETREKCQRMVAEAKQQSQAYWDDYMARVRQFIDSNEALRRYLEEHGTSM